MIEHMFDTMRGSGVEADVDPWVTAEELAWLRSEVPGDPFPLWDGAHDGVDVDGTDRDGESRIPVDLDAMAPGIVMAAVLDGVDVHRLSGHDRVVVLRAQHKMASHFQAKVYESMGAIVDAYGEDPELAPNGEDLCMLSAAEIRTALRWTRRGTDKELSFALDLRRRIPRVFEALAAGRIDIRRAKTFEYHTIDLPVATARAVVDAVIDDAGGLTSGELAARLRRLRIDAEPDEAKRRLDQIVSERRVVMEPTPEGAANIHAYGLVPDRAAELMNTLHRTALNLRRDGDQRSMDQLRADVLVDLPRAISATGGGDVPMARGTVNIHVDLDTLARLNDDAGELAGFGPVVADIARQVTDRLGDGVWEYTVEDRSSGMPIDTGTTRRRPTMSQKRMVRSRDRRCVFPGCRMPAAESDLDHRTPWAESHTTSADDLAPLCRHDHCIRHQAQWTYRRTADGDYLWTSPLGHTYTTTGRDP